MIRETLKVSDTLFVLRLRGWSVCGGLFRDYITIRLMRDLLKMEYIFRYIIVVNCKFLLGFLKIASVRKLVLNNVQCSFFILVLKIISLFGIAII